MDDRPPRLVTITSSWSTKSKSIWSASLPLGIIVVVSPRGVTKSVEFHQWFTRGVSASRIFPMTCVHMWTA